MDQEQQDPLNTREFLALWNVAKEEHLGHRLAEVLDRLAGRGILPAMTEAQRAVLAHALQLAGDPAAGIPEALQYLETIAGDPSGSPPGA
ncbi:MAG TPA: hypothetical protein VFT84_04705 [Gemmatimonadales bacterium]|nr:hypothetical protein [Gemmatimonadales bacterium]